jgi:excisionase family DNA binding protein
MTNAGTQCSDSKSNSLTPMITTAGGVAAPNGKNATAAIQSRLLKRQKRAAIETDNVAPCGVSRSTTMIENLMTVEQVAKYFAVSKATVRRWEKLGAIKGVRIAGSLRFEVAALRGFLQREAAKRNALAPALASPLQINS